MKMKLNNNNLNNLIKFPTPMNISSMWNFGSLLGMCLTLQIITGLFLAFQYMSSTMLAFDSVNNIMNEVWKGFMFRNIHANGASLIFMLLYFHIGRSIYYKSYMMKKPWMIGVMMFLMMMMTAFLGYVLPWGQMSYWGSTVIISLISSIPYLGDYLIQWIWGGYSVSNPTLTRFFCLHFILPFMISLMTTTHIFFLHKTGSNNPLGISSKNNKLMFNPYYTIKDLFWAMKTFILLIIIIIYYTYYLMDSENFILANQMITPEQIKPEWYFLFAYAILRSIPSKLGGVIALLMSILILFFLPIFNLSKFNSNQFLISKIMFWMLLITVLMLTWIGMNPVEEPFILIGQIFSINYFLLFLLMPMLELMMYKLI